jgi:hypothetical protein
VKLIKILNFLGGSLFASGLMLGLQNYINTDGDRTRQTIVADGAWTRLTIIAQNYVPKPKEQPKIDREYSQSMDMVSIAIFQASLGAGLACLRESKD